MTRFRWVTTVVNLWPEDIAPTAAPFVFGGRGGGGYANPHPHCTAIRLSTAAEDGTDPPPPPAPPQASGARRVCPQAAVPALWQPTAVGGHWTVSC